jgi:selenocysteine-specific elongation factor
LSTLILGTAGHIDHGKTALVRALTGIDTDRLPEEKQRGITIDIGFARLALDDETEIGIVDVPGHEAFIRNMLAGATGIDMALLVIAADEGVMPQTREHLDILELLAVRAIIVVLSKSDLVDAEWLDLVRDDVKSVLAPTPYRAAPIVAVSAVSGEGIESLRDTLAREATSLEARDADDIFRMPIDRIFTVRGTGTVVTGTVWSGRITTDAAVHLLPRGGRIRVRGIQTHGRQRDDARAGERAALALAGIPRDDIVRGDSLVAGDGWQAAHIVTVQLHALAAAPPIRTRQRVRFHLGTAEVLGRVSLLESGPLEPGNEAWAQIRLEQPVVARAGDRFVLRSYSPVTTIAGGRIAEPFAPKRKRTSAAVRDSLRAILDGSNVHAIEAAASLAGFAGLAEESVSVSIPGRATPSHILWNDAFRANNRIFHPAVAEEARSAVVSAVRQFHERQPLAPGIDREALRHLLPAHAHPLLADAIIDELLENGLLAADGHTIRRADFRASLNSAQVSAADAIEALFREAGLASPGLDDIPPPLAGRKDLEDLIHYLQRAGRLVSLPAHRWIHPAPLEAAIALARHHFGDRGDLSPADFRDLFGISRKYLIPLLEHFDRTGVTGRNGDARRVEPSVPESHGGA